MGFEISILGFKTIINPHKTFAEAKKKAQVKGALINISMISGFIIFPLVFLLTVFTFMNGSIASAIFNLIQNFILSLFLLLIIVIIFEIVLIAWQALLVNIICKGAGLKTKFTEIFYLHSILILANAWLVIFSLVAIITTGPLGLLLSVVAFGYSIYLNIALVSEVSESKGSKPVLIGTINALVSVIMVLTLLSLVVPLNPMPMPRVFNAKVVIPELIEKTFQKGGGLEIKSNVEFTPGSITSKEVSIQTKISEDSIAFSCAKSAVLCGPEKPIVITNNAIKVYSTVAATVAVCTKDGRKYHLIVGELPEKTEKDAIEKCGLE